MALEIERKFLVRDDSWQDHVQGRRNLRQGYLTAGGEVTVRVRTDGSRAWVTIKGASRGISRAEFEYEIPPTDAEALLALCQGRLVEKCRHIVPHGDKAWEVDVFSGCNRGLVLAEIELATDSETVELPSWIGEEVSHDPRYSNARLAVTPFSRW